MKKILVGYDGSEGSELALHKAITIVDDDGGLIIIAVVPGPSEGRLIDETTYSQLREKAQNMINQTIHDLSSSEYSVRGLVVEDGDIATRIIDTANKENCDLIVLGSRGTSEISGPLLGSVTNKVVQYAHKPVMVVR